MSETIKKHIGEGFGKGELYAALAYDAGDAFGGMKIKNVMFNETGKAYFYDSGMYIGASADGALVIASDTSITLEAPTVNVSVTASSDFTDPVTITYNCVAAAVSDLTITSVSSDATGGSTVIKPLYVNATMSGSGGLGRAIEGKLLVSGKLGTYGNAIKGYIDFTGGSGTSGLASAICAEMKMSAGATLGTFGVLELELVCPGSWTAGQGTGTNSISLIYAQTSGATASQFDSYGYLFNLQGLTAGSTKLLYNNTLKCVIGSTAWYLPLSSAQGSYTTAYPIVCSNATASTSTTTGAVIITGGLGVAGATFLSTLNVGSFFDMGTMDVGIAVTSDDPFAMEVHTEPLTTLVAGDTGLSCGIRSRYHITVAQANQISICAIDARLRVKHALADGVHCGINAGIEASTATADFTGTATTQRCAGHFYLDFDELGSLAGDGWLTGITIDSSVHASLSVAAVTFAALRIKKSSGKLNWEYGAYIDDCDVGIYMEPSGMTHALLIGAPSTSSGSGHPIGTAYSATGAPVGIYFDDAGVAITSWGEGFTVGTVYTAASTAQGQTGMPYTAFFYNDVRAAFNGAASCGWSTAMTSFCMTGALAGFDNVGVSSLHTSVDLNATSSLSEETTLSCISFGGNWIAGTYDASTDGLIVPLNVRPTNQNWSAFLHLPASANGCYEAYAGEGTGAYSIKVYVGSTATWIHTYNQA